MANDFGKDLDKYLDQRQTAPPTDFIIKRKKQNKEQEEKVPELDGQSILIEGRELSFFEKIFSKRKDKDYPEVEEAIDEAIYETDDVTELEKEYEELDEAEEALEERKTGIFAKIMDKIRHATIEEEQVDVSVPDGDVVYDKDTFIVPDDLKDAMRIQNEWLKKLGRAQLNAFKVSEDYKRYQEVLRKYGLIK